MGLIWSVDWRVGLVGSFGIEAVGVHTGRGFSFCSNGKSGQSCLPPSALSAKLS